MDLDTGIDLDSLQDARELGVKANIFKAIEGTMSSINL